MAICYTCFSGFTPQQTFTTILRKNSVCDRCCRLINEIALESVVPIEGKICHVISFKENMHEVYLSKVFNDYMIGKKMEIILYEDLFNEYRMLWTLVEALFNPVVLIVFKRLNQKETEHLFN